MDILAIIVFIQIVFESLPVSSSSHVDLFLLLLSRSGVVVQLPPGFDHFLHGPTVLVLVLFFHKEWFCLLRAMLKGKRLAIKIFLKLFNFAFIANLITAFFYLIIKVLLDGKLTWFVTSYFVIPGLLLTAFSLLSLKFKDEGSDVLNLKKIIVLGIIQGIALLPGVSRFASTYVAGRFLNLSAKRSFQISFMIQFPLCIAAFVKGLHDINNFVVTLPIGISFVIGVPVAVYCLGFAYRLALSRSFWKFGFYMLIPIASFVAIAAFR